MKIFYFTGTGNSYWTAKKIGEHFSAEVHSIIDYKNEKGIVVDDDVLGFVFPTYMSDIPWITKEFLLKLSSPRKPYIFAVMTSNHGQSGKSALNLDRALHTNGLTLSAAFDLQMPGNCIESTAQQDGERLKLAPEKVNTICQDIENRRTNFTSPKQLAGARFVKKSWFYSPHSIMKNLKVIKGCTGCGICAKVCPMDNIDILSDKAVHHKDCAACYACIHWCPENATILNVPTFTHLRRYHHPEVSLGEIIPE